MTLPCERTRAVLLVEQRIMALGKHLNGRGETTRVKRELIRDLWRALRHYPTRADLIVSAEKAPTIWEDPGEDSNSAGV